MSTIIGCMVYASSVSVFRIFISKDLIHCTKSTTVLCNSFIPSCRNRLRGGGHYSTKCVAVCFLYPKSHTVNGLNRRSQSISPVLQCLTRSLFKATLSFLGFDYRLSLICPNFYMTLSFILPTVGFIRIESKTH